MNIKMFDISSEDNFMVFSKLLYGYLVKLKNEVIGKFI